MFFELWKGKCTQNCSFHIPKTAKNCDKTSFESVETTAVQLGPARAASINTCSEQQDYALTKVNSENQLTL